MKNIVHLPTFFDQILIMSAYLYAIIPYKIGDSFCPDEGESYMSSLMNNVEIPALKGVVSEFADIDYVFEDFLLKITCYRQSVLANSVDGYNWFRAEIYKIVKALGAHEAWYVEELCGDEIFAENFSLSYEEWVCEQRTKNQDCMTELTVDVLKGDILYGLYHDDFSDLII